MCQEDKRNQTNLFMKRKYFGLYNLELQSPSLEDNHSCNRSGQNPAWGFRGEVKPEGSY